MADNLNPTDMLMVRARKAGAYSASPEVMAGNGNDVVYMGDGYKSPYLAGDRVPAVYQDRVEVSQMRQTVFSRDKASLYLMNMDPEEFAKVQAYANAENNYEVKSLNLLKSAWNDMLDTSQQLSTLYGTPVTPWEAAEYNMQMRERMGLSGDKSGGGGGGGYSGPVTSTSVQLSSASDAELLVDQALTNYLGRQADEGEREKFWELLKKGQRANPTVSVTTPNGPGEQSSVTTGGFNEQQAATEFALSQKDSAEYMANTQYMDWLMESVSQDSTEGIASGL